MLLFPGNTSESAPHHSNPPLVSSCFFPELLLLLLLSFRPDTTGCQRDTRWMWKMGCEVAMATENPLSVLLSTEMNTEGDLG
uniref:Uncharacterized protein n=1 Tax=Knipowitschia caucasica TaxID=637954 RepID=A0AAV2LIL0_KNICA